MNTQEKENPLLTNILSCIYTAKSDTQIAVKAVDVKVSTSDPVAQEAVRALKKMGYAIEPRPSDYAGHHVLAITWPHREIFTRRHDTPDQPATSVDATDFERHGFAMAPRQSPDAPFVFYKPVMVDMDGKPMDWEDHGFFLQAVMEMPSGHTIIQLVSPEVFCLHKNKHMMKDQPTHFYGAIRTPEEIDMVMRMCFERDACFNLNPAEPAPPTNWWVDLALRIEKSQPKTN